MVITYHIILTGYGHWIPNDPRGSMSRAVYSPEIAKLAETHFGRKPVQPTLTQLREFYRKAEQILYYPVLWWNNVQRAALADAFGQCVGSLGLTCYACAVLRNHAHLLIRRHRLKAEEMSRSLKQVGRETLMGRGDAPENHPVFSADSCHVYKSSVESTESCIAYIADNYPKHRLTPVPCLWVVEYDRWPNHKAVRRRIR